MKSWAERRLAGRWGTDQLGPISHPPSPSHTWRVSAGHTPRRCTAQARMSGSVTAGSQPGGGGGAARPPSSSRSLSTGRSQAWTKSSSSWRCAALKGGASGRRSAAKAAATSAGGARSGMSLRQRLTKVCVPAYLHRPSPGKYTSQPGSRASSHKGLAVGEELRGMAGAQQLPQRLV